MRRAEQLRAGHAARGRHTSDRGRPRGVRQPGEGVDRPAVRRRPPHPPRRGPRPGRGPGSARLRLAGRARPARPRRVGCLALSPHRARLLPGGRARSGTGPWSSCTWCPTRSPSAPLRPLRGGRRARPPRARLGRLPIDQRAVMVLHFYLDLPLTEAAGILGVPVGTAKSRLHRGLATLREAMRAEPGPPILAPARERTA